MRRRASSLQHFILRVLDTTGPASLGQLVWARDNAAAFEQWDPAGTLPTTPARSNRSLYNSMRRSLELLVERRVLVKELDDGGHHRYRRPPAPHWQKAVALSSLAQAKLGPEHYRQLVKADATSETVLLAVCSATGWNSDKARTAVESIAEVLGG